MPSIPGSNGAAGSHDGTSPGKTEQAPKVPPQTPGPAGGYDIPFDTHGAPPTVRPTYQPPTGLTTKDPEFGTR